MRFAAWITFVWLTGVFAGVAITNSRWSSSANDAGLVYRDEHGRSKWSLRLKIVPLESFEMQMVRPLPGMSKATLETEHPVIGRFLREGNAWVEANKPDGSPATDISVRNGP